MKERKSEKIEAIKNQIRMIENSIKAIFAVQGPHSADKRAKKYPQKIQNLQQKLE